MEIALDDDVRPLKAVWPVPVALFDLHISSDRDIAFEQHGVALLGLNVAADRRRLCIPVDQQGGTLLGQHIAAHIHEAKGTVRVCGYNDIPLDTERSRCVAAHHAGASYVGSPSGRRAYKRRGCRHH